MLVSQVVAPGVSRVVEEELSAPDAQQVVVEVLACGVCTSDLRAWHDGSPNAEPLRLGHEVAGRVTATGHETAQWQVGDLVTGLAGNGFATHVMMEADVILPIPNGIPPELALGEPLACLVEALSRVSIDHRSRVAIVGLGFMGLGLVQLVSALAPGLLVGIDASHAARDRALALGADETYHPDAVPHEGVAVGSARREPGMDVVIEAVGTTSALTACADLLRPFGTACIVGYHRGEAMSVDMRFWYKAITLVNGFSPDQTRNIRAMQQGLTEIANRRFTYAPLITHRFDLAGVDEAFELMTRRPEDFVKSVILPAGS